MWTVLHHACACPYLAIQMCASAQAVREMNEQVNDVISFAYEIGVDVNAQSSFGDTALHLAVVNKAVNAVNFFLEQTPIDLSLRDKDGKTAEKCCETPQLKAMFKEKRYFPEAYGDYLAARMGLDMTNYVNQAVVITEELTTAGKGFVATRDLKAGELILRE
jgi:hypothetical protein